MSDLIRTLSRARSQERSYRLAWGIARWLAVAVGLLAVCCAIDYWIDRTRETPWLLRLAMTATQLIVSAVLISRLVWKLNLPSLDALAAQAEGLMPKFQHRLVTALQLNRDAARTEGMSRELIADVTREAEKLAKQPDFPTLADVTQLKRALYLIIPVMIFGGGWFAIAPKLTGTLVLRQVLLPIDIARSVQLENQTAELWPNGEAVNVRIKVTGNVPDDTLGVLKVFPDDQPTETFELKLAERTSDTEAIYFVQLPPASTPMIFRAWLGGGRLRQPGTIKFDTRPVVQEIEASVVLPRYVDPTGKREYQRYMPLGEVYALADSEVIVNATISKPVKSAQVVVLGKNERGLEIEIQRLPMELLPEKQVAGLRFRLPAKPVAYRIECTDDNGFTNMNPLQRGITIAPDRPPEVRLLPEVLKDPKEDGPIDDFLVDGMPLRLGGQVQVGYYAKSPLGLSKAYIVYRVNDGPWVALTLTNTVADLSKVGKFIPELGVFWESGPFGQVEFYPIPAVNPEQDPDGLTAGGRFNFKTSALKKKVKNGNTWTDAELEVGDTVEIRVALLDRHPGPFQPPTNLPRVTDSSEPAVAPTKDNRRSPGWSPESRIKQIVSDSKFEAWRQEHYRGRVKLGELEQKQRAVFQGPK
ncbi:MAG: hypothetical protein ACRC8S_13060 [Fimbriiglobus sp.]